MLSSSSHSILTCLNKSNVVKQIKTGICAQTLLFHIRVDNFKLMQLKGCIVLQIASLLWMEKNYKLFHNLGESLLAIYIIMLQLHK